MMINNEKSLFDCIRNNIWAENDKYKFFGKLMMKEAQALAVLSWILLRMSVAFYIDRLSSIFLLLDNYRSFMFYRAFLFIV